MGLMTTDDEKFGEFLRREARAYNLPPGDVPREEMWREIGTRRRAVAPRRRRLGAWIGLAAALLVGVAIGRYTTRGAGGEQDATRSALVAAPPAGGTDTGLAYRVAARDHLARAEALLTAYRSADPGATPDTQMTEWARDVLQNTRLLLDSPGGADPARRQLLRDLEAVLVQMIQRSPAPVGPTEARAQVYRSIERTHVLTRLRSTRTVSVNGGN